MIFRDNQICERAAKKMKRRTKFASFILWVWSGAKECTSCRSRKLLNMSTKHLVQYTCKDRRWYSRERARSRSMKYQLYLYFLRWAQRTGGYACTRVPMCSAGAWCAGSAPRRRTRWWGAAIRQTLRPWLRRWTNQRWMRCTFGSVLPPRHARWHWKLGPPSWLAR